MQNCAFSKSFVRHLIKIIFFVEKIRFSVFGFWVGGWGQNLNLFFDPDSFPKTRYCFLTAFGLSGPISDNQTPTPNPKELVWFCIFILGHVGQFGPRVFCLVDQVHRSHKTAQVRRWDQPSQLRTRRGRVRNRGRSTLPTQKFSAAAFFPGFGRISAELCWSWLTYGTVIACIYQWSEVNNSGLFDHFNYSYFYFLKKEKYLSWFSQAKTVLARALKLTDFHICLAPSC